MEIRFYLESICQIITSSVRLLLRKSPGIVPVSVAFEDGFWSSGTTNYLYYDQPSISSIEPMCGPEHGYTQITVFGKNFVDLGVGKVQCVFNRTIFMNATVME